MPVNPNEWYKGHVVHVSHIRCVKGNAIMIRFHVRLPCCTIDLENILNPVFLIIFYLVKKIWILSLLIVKVSNCLYHIPLFCIILVQERLEVCNVLCAIRYNEFCPIEI